MPPSTSRQPYALFWWLLATAMLAWPAATWFWTLYGPAEPETFFHAFVDTAGPMWKFEALDVLWPIRDPLTAAVPVIVGLLAWTVAVRGPGRPKVHLWATATALGVLGLQLAYKAVFDWLSEIPDGPPVLHQIDWVGAGWTYAPLVLLLVAGRAGLALPRRRGTVRRAMRWLAWPPVVAAGAVVALLVAVAVVRSARWEPPAAQVQSDGTPRHALALSGRDLISLDLADGEQAGEATAPDRELYNFRAIARDVAPGHYVAAASDIGPSQWDVKARSRIYRVEVDGDGRVTVGAPLGPVIDGVIRDLAVSPTGAVAYSTMVPTGNGENGPEIAFTRVGVLDPSRAWQTPGGDPFLEDTIDLRWSGARTLTYWHEGALLTLDLDARTKDLARGRRQRTFPGLRDYGALHTLQVAADGTQLGGLASYAEGPMIIVLHPKSGRPLGRVLDGVGTFTLDATGRHLLAVVLGREEDGEVSSRIVRIDLTALPPASPDPYGMAYAQDLNMPRHVLMDLPAEVAALAW